MALPFIFLATFPDYTSEYNTYYCTYSNRDRNQDVLAYVSVISQGKKFAQVMAAEVKGQKGNAQFSTVKHCSR